MSRALARHLEHARNPQWVFEPRDVIGIRKLLNGWTRFADGSMRPKMRAHFDQIGMAALAREEACNKLRDTLASIPHAISPDFESKGLRWFDSMRLYRNADQSRVPFYEWRNTALSRQFDARKRAIVDGFERFEFVGFANPGGRWYWPVYRVHGNGDTFDYCYGSWQSGQRDIYFPRDPVHVESGKFYQLDVSKCPHVIMVPEHYRNDGTCLCDDPNAKIMRTWGYKWSKAKGVWS